MLAGDRTLRFCVGTTKTSAQYPKLLFYRQLPDRPHASGHRSQLATQPPVFSKMFVAQLVQSNYCIDEDDEGVKMTRDGYYLRKLLGLQIYNKTTYTDEGIP